MTQSARIRKTIKTRPNSIGRRLRATNNTSGGGLSAGRVLMPLIASLLLGTTLPALLFSATPESATHSDSAFSLSDTCPASFELKDGGCILRNRYRAYRSLRDAGVGGLKTGLPPLREGFTPQQIDLGRYLFFDPILSADGSISCASCHDPALGFSDGRGQAIGQKVRELAICKFQLRFGG